MFLRLVLLAGSASVSLVAGRHSRDVPVTTKLRCLARKADILSFSSSVVHTVSVDLS